MELLVNGHKTFCYTGGKPFDPAQPTVVLIHGVLNDHSVWAMQSRYLAHHGWNVLAVDLPGHCKSAGPAPASVEEAADFIIALLDAVGAPRAALVGHSWGSLIALEAAARLQERVSHLALVGTAFPMKVSPAPSGLITSAVLWNSNRSAFTRTHRGGAERAREGAAHGQRVLAQHLVRPTHGAGPGHLGVWRQHGAGPPRAAQQPRRKPVPPGLRRLRQLHRGRSGYRPHHLPRAVCPGRAGPDDHTQSGPRPDCNGAR